jgi:urate oxidase
MADTRDAHLSLHQHGKSRVRVGRVWREGNVHHMVEWMVHTMIESDMEKAFLEGDNTGMTATDTQKNTVRVGCASDQRTRSL